MLNVSVSEPKYFTSSDRTINKEFVLYEILSSTGEVSRSV